MFTDYSGHGRCRDGQCVCYEGWTGQGKIAPFGRAQTVSRVRIVPASVLKTRTAAPETNRARRAATCSQTAAGTGDAAMASASATRDGQGKNAPFGRAKTASKSRSVEKSVHRAARYAETARGLVRRNATMATPCQATDARQLAQSSAASIAWGAPQPLRTRAHRPAATG